MFNQFQLFPFFRRKSEMSNYSGPWDPGEEGGWGQDNSEMHTSQRKLKTIGKQLKFLKRN